MILWKHRESGETCHVNYTDFDGEITVVLVTYFGGEEQSFSEIYPVEEFFEEHEPERTHA